MRMMKVMMKFFTDALFPFDKLINQIQMTLVFMRLNSVYGFLSASVYFLAFISVFILYTYS